MATTPKPNATKEMIGMRVKGIEDYTNDFDDHSYSGSSSADTYETASTRFSSKQGMIRNSFQVLLPIASPAASVKLHPLPLPMSQLNLNQSRSEEEMFMSDHNNRMRMEDQVRDEEESFGSRNTVEQLLIFDALIQEAKSKQQSLPKKPQDLQIEQLSLLELDEDGSSPNDTLYTSTEEEESTDDDDSSSGDDDSSSWGDDEEVFDEGGITYFATLTTKPDLNVNAFALTPFESVVDDATKQLKIKYDKIIYPPGSKFHSKDLLETEDYHRLQNIQFVKWIKSSHDDNEIKSETKEKSSVLIWLKKSINEVYSYYRGKDRNDLEFCYYLIDSSIFQHFDNDGYKMMLNQEERESYPLFKLFELLLHTLGRLCSKLSSKRALHRFYEYLELTKKMFPSFKVHLDLLKETLKAHRHKKNANHCISAFVEIYYRNQYSSRCHDLASFELSVKALVALDLYISCYSPLNHSILSDAAAYDINSESFKWLDAYYHKYNNNESSDEYGDISYDHHNSLHLLKLELCSNPQSRMAKLTEKYEQFIGFSFLRSRCCWVIGHSKLYHQRQFYDSEKYFFEALYCLKTLTKHEFFPLNGTIQTELASLVLIDYADVLLENKKYQYAINALEKVMQCLSERQKEERKFQIIRKLCITCTEKEDWNRAIKYHNITLKKLKDNYLNLNEFVYLSQQISTIYLKLNNFNQSEKELQNGIKTIYLNVLSYHSQDHRNRNIKYKDIDYLSMDHIFEHCQGEERMSIGSLLLVLANLYISGGYYLFQSIHILTYLKKYIFRNQRETRLLTIYFQLTRAYFKNGRYKIADDIMEKEILSRYSSSNKDLLSSLEFVQLRILIMIHCKRFDSALELLEDTITHMIQKESFVKRAKINYLKGRVLQSRCFDELIKMYDEMDDVDNKEEEEEKGPSLVAAAHDIGNKYKPQHRRGGGGAHGAGNGLLTLDMTIRSDDTSEITPLDAISSLLLSHSDYKSIDSIMQAKCCLELSKTYLEIMMEYYALPHHVLMDTKRSDNILSWLGMKIFNDDKTPNDEVITHCLDEIYRPLYTALTLSTTETKDIALLIESYIALAEFEFLTNQNEEDVKDVNLYDDDDNNNNDDIQNNNNQKSKNFWKQSVITLFSTYKDSDDWIFLRRIDRHSRLQIFDLFKRILRLLVCYDNSFIADNVSIFVSYIALETFMIAQRDIIIDIDIDENKEEEIRTPRTQNNNTNNNNNKTGEFGRYTSVSAKVYASMNNKTEQEKTEQKESSDEISIMNPTVTFRINDQDIMNDIETVTNEMGNIRPLYRRYPNYDALEQRSEKYLDELFRMHWKMRTEANMFSGGRSTEIDNDKSLVQITKCISALNVSLDISSTLNRTHRSWRCNETFIIALDSFVFMFHPHTLCKYGIRKKSNNNNNVLDGFVDKLSDIAFHDSDFLSSSDNPWINNNLLEEKEEEKDIVSHNERIRMKLNNKGRFGVKTNKHSLSPTKEFSLRRELSLPYLKLESISELLMCLDPQNILALFGAIFSESPIIIVSKERCRCLAVIDALCVLMYPFSWQYPIIPWLSRRCFSLLSLPIPYIFGCGHHLSGAANNKIVIVDADTNTVIKRSKETLLLPLKLKSKLTRAMFRLMSGLLKNSFAVNKNWVFPPRRRDNMNSSNNYDIDSKYNLLRSPRTLPISSCSERKTWYKDSASKMSNSESMTMKKQIINFQKECCTAWVEVLEQYRLFWVNINSALHQDLKEKSEKRIQKYAHPRYRKFLTELQKTRMFSSFQCIRSLANAELLSTPMFDNLVMRSLRFRQSLYHEIIQQQKQEQNRMKVSVINNKDRYFINHYCTVRFQPNNCTLYIKPDKLQSFEVKLQATIYELLIVDDQNKQHPYIERKQVQEYGTRYQFKILHDNDGILTLNCRNYYQLTRWIHILRTHSMDTWSWSLKF